MSELYRDFIDGKADEIVTALGGTITPAPANAELYRDFLDRKFNDVIIALNYEPKFLGNSVTAEQYDEIDSGKLTTMKSGDYWTINNHDYILADYDYWYNRGNPRVTNHHAVIVSKKSLVQSKPWNFSPNTTAGGYAYSEIRGGTQNEDSFTGDGTTTTFTLSHATELNVEVRINNVVQNTNSYTMTGTTLTFNNPPANNSAILARYRYLNYLSSGGLKDCKDIIDVDFGAPHILSRKAYLTNSVSNGVAINYALFDSSIELMSEIQLLGHSIVSSAGKYYEAGFEDTQLDVFKKYPDLIWNDLYYYYWLRNIATNSGVAGVNYNGFVNAGNTAYGVAHVRPVFAIIK